MFSHCPNFTKHPTLLTLQKCPHSVSQDVLLSQNIFSISKKVLTFQNVVTPRKNPQVPKMSQHLKNDLTSENESRIKNVPFLSLHKMSFLL